MPLYDDIVNDLITIKVISIGDYQSNCTFIIDNHSKKTIIVDPGFDGDTILDIIKENHLIVSKIIHTHAHFDHAGHSTYIHKKTDAPMYLHASDNDLYNNLQEYGRLFGREIPKPTPIQHSLNDGEQISIDESHPVKFKVIHTPGHTPGCCSFYTENLDSPLLIAGDTLFRLSIGRTDLPGGSFEQIISSIKNKLFTLPENTFVVTGHGPGTTIGFEKKSNPFLQ